MILPKRQELDKEKAKERKREIDNGMNLARQVDDLRQTLAQEKLLHENWLASTREQVSKILASFDEEKHVKKHELDELAEARKKLIEPLDSEWKELEKEQELFAKVKIELISREEGLEKREQTVIENEKFITKSLEEIDVAKQESIQETKESKRLKDLALNEYATSRHLGKRQWEDYEQKMAGLKQLDKQYKVALTTIEIREKQVDEKEVDLANRERALTDRYATLERTMKRLSIKKP